MDYFNKMDGAGGYVRASLLGLSQGMSPLHDPLRLHPAFNSQYMFQISDAGKDGQGLLRPLSDYPHLPLLPFSAPPFLPPMHLDPRLPFSHSAFHQLHSKLPQVTTSSSSLNTSTNITSSNSLPGSAFAPLPPKVSKMEPDVGQSPISCVTSSGLFNHSVLLSNALDARNAFLGGRSPTLIPGGPMSDERRDSPSPMGSLGSRESPAQAREASTPTSPGDDMRDSSCTTETFWNRFMKNERIRKNRPPGDYWCPVCGNTLRPGEVDSHLGMELDKLAKHILPSKSPHVTSSGAGVNNSISNNPHMNQTVKMRDPGWETYQRVKANRQVRLKHKKRRSGRGDETPCPVCGERFLAQEDFQTHVEQCIRRQNVPEEEEVDVEGDSPLEEYEWCGQRRVRVSSALFRQQNQPMQVNRESDTDNSPEKDSNSSDKSRTGGVPARDGAGEEDRRAREGAGEEERRERVDEGRERERIAAEALEKELETLKEKIRSMERDAGNNSAKFQCLVCQHAYDRPAVSMICWHVFCEACWPHSLETKSECPQCSVAFNAGDIRIIQL